MTTQDLRALLKRANITQGAAAARCGVTLRTMQNWVSGATRIPPTAMNEMIIMEGEQDFEQFERECPEPQNADDARSVLESITADQMRHIAVLEAALESARESLNETRARIAAL